jgi:hypothetical protein
MGVDKEIDEIRRMGKLRKQNEDGAKSKKIEDRIGGSGETAEVADGIAKCRSGWVRLKIA